MAHDVRHATDTGLPLNPPRVPLTLRDHVALADYPDLLPCNVVSKNRQGQLVQVRRGVAVDAWRLLLLEPDAARPGFACLRFIADLNFVAVAADAHNSRALVVSVASASADAAEVFSGRFIFDDTIRCVAQRQVGVVFRSLS